MTGRRILCFGDSLTWGWIPKEEGFPTERYPWGQRWTGVMHAALGGDDVVVEEGLSGRTTNIDDPTDPRLNGSNYLPACLASHLPLDLAILMLGTNDTKTYLHREPIDIAAGMAVLAGQVAGSAGGVGTTYPAPKLLIVAPPPLGDVQSPWLRDTFDAGSVEKSAALASVYESLATGFHVGFLDAGSVLTTNGVDGVHFTEENNRAFGTAVASKVAELLES